MYIKLHNSAYGWPTYTAPKFYNKTFPIIALTYMRENSSAISYSQIKQHKCLIKIAGSEMFTRLPLQSGHNNTAI